LSCARLLALLLAVLTAGCAVQTQALRATPPAGLPARAELVATPFFPQTDYQCGPAALATALGSAGYAAQPAQLAEQVFLPARTGTLQIEMIAGARRQGAVATRLPATLEAALREVAAGTPVVVLLNLGLNWYPAWHYAVLVGYDLDAGEVLLRSGTTQRAVLAMRSFEHTWTRAGAWAFAVTRPGQWPATAEPRAIVDAALGFERAAAPVDAALAYRSALQRTGADLTLQMGLGNSLYAAGDKPAAAQAFQRAAEDHPGNAPAWINLASTRGELGDAPGADDAARRAVALNDPAWQAQADAALRRALGAGPAPGRPKPDDAQGPRRGPAWPLGQERSDWGAQPQLKVSSGLK
jgi:tetratricopeptide (TPR) repeat protein